MHAIFFTGNTFHIGNILIQLVQSLYARITHTLVILDFLFQTRLLQTMLPSQYQVVLVKDTNNRQEEQYRNRILIPSYTSQKVLHFTHTFYFDSFDFTKIEVLIDKFYHLIAKKRFFIHSLYGMAIVQLSFQKSSGVPSVSYSMGSHMWREFFRLRGIQRSAMKMYWSVPSILKM